MTMLFTTFRDSSTNGQVDFEVAGRGWSTADVRRLVAQRGRSEQSAIDNAITVTHNCVTVVVE